MTTVKNQRSSYLSRAKLASAKTPSSAKARTPHANERQHRAIEFIDAAGYVHWKLPTKRAG
jgi:hypothetical protein